MNIVSASFHFFPMGRVELTSTSIMQTMFMDKKIAK